MSTESQPKTRLIDGKPATVLWEPNPGPQTAFLASRADEVLYGGAAGGGKSAASIALPLRWVGNPRFRCLFLRREAAYLGDAIDKSTLLYPKFGARPVRSPRFIWTFPSGAQVWLGHCQHIDDIQNYDSFEFHLIIFEELTHFAEPMYRRLRARIRGTDPTLPRYTRSTCNPGGEGHEWVFRRFGPWLDPKSPIRAAPGELLWYVGDELVPQGTPDALSRTFIPAKLTDNPHVTKEYRAQLKSLDAVRRAQLLEGDWLVRPAAGKYFKREWVKNRFVDAAPTGTRWIRYWDRAATEPSEENPDPDWTRGVKLGLHDGLIYVGHVASTRSKPLGVQNLVLEIADEDGPDVEIGIEQDPGSAGVAEAAAYVRMLRKYNVREHPVSAKKELRFSPFSAQAEAGNVRIVRGPWNEVYLDELEAFPQKGVHDDQVDATSGAYNTLVDEPEKSAADDWAAAALDEWS